MISKSSRSAKRDRTCNPVVPASPSMKIFFLALSAESQKRLLAVRVVKVGLKAEVVPAIARKSESVDVLVTIFVDCVVRRVEASMDG